MLQGSGNPPTTTMQRLFVLLVAGAVAAPAFAQSTGAPLDLTVPPGAVPVAASTTAAHPHEIAHGAPAAATTAATPAHAAPGVYYGDTSGRIYSAATARRAPACDDSTYNQTQMHGSVSTGVYSARHWGSGSWGGATVNISKAFGSCEHPTGGVSISIGGANGSVHGH